MQTRLGWMSAAQCKLAEVIWTRRHCMKTKQIMMSNPALLHGLLEHLTEALIVYVCHQIDCGAQVAIHTRTYARTHARTHAHTDTRMHTRTKHTPTPPEHGIMMAT